MARASGAIGRGGRCAPVCNWNGGGLCPLHAASLLAASAFALGAMATFAETARRWIRLPAYFFGSRAVVAVVALSRGNGPFGFGVPLRPVLLFSPRLARALGDAEREAQLRYRGNSKSTVWVLWQLRD